MINADGDNTLFSNIHSVFLLKFFMSYDNSMLISYLHVKFSSIKQLPVFSIVSKYKWTNITFLILLYNSRHPLRRIMAFFLFLGNIAGFSSLTFSNIFINSVVSKQLSLAWRHWVSFTVNCWFSGYGIIIITIMITITTTTINNYSPQAQLVLLNNSREEVEGNFSTIKKRLVWLTDEFMREHVAVNRRCAKVRSLQYLQTWQIIVLIIL